MSVACDDPTVLVDEIVLGSLLTNMVLGGTALMEVRIDKGVSGSPETNRKSHQSQFSAERRCC